MKYLSCKFKSLVYTAVFIFTGFTTNFCQAQKAGVKLPYQNYNLSFKQRVDDLISRMTLEEKVAQMMNLAPAIPRLGVPAYDWWNEVLHGVARTPYNVTVFPQAIAMAATWDKNSIYTMADYAALEGRAIQNKAIALGKTGDRYLGLTYWTPNINIFRDPRWGRGQETYGEDPFLTAMMGNSFVQGLQGNDPKYLKAAACAKHYAVHSGPESTRHYFDAEVSDYDLWDTYLPAFRKLVVDAKVVGVMCAYNELRKQPCCGNDLLMTDILRHQWGFTGYVTSDCGGITNFYLTHKTHPNAEEAAADAVYHGTDLECGNSAYKALIQGVKDNKTNEKQIDISVKRLFMIRFRLGMFDPPAMVKYAQTPASALESPEHKAHALKMAQQSIVLLRNQDHTLPLSKKLKKIIVLGPNADSRVTQLGNYNGIPSNIVTVLDGIKQKVGSGTQVVYEKAVNYTDDTVMVYQDMKGRYSYNNMQGFKAEYFNNRELKGEPVLTRTEDALNHSWQEGQKIGGDLRTGNFSSRYTTNLKATADGPLTFEIGADGGFRFNVNGKEVINSWAAKRIGTKAYKLQMKKDSVYKLVLEYCQGDAQAAIALNTGTIIQTDLDALKTRIKDADAIVFAGGISPTLEGENMRVRYPGFSGGDRTTILLPTAQTRLLKALKETGKPIVFVMMTGSAIAMPWEAENIPAIVNAWYGGQSAGTAVADVLFGDYNPAGRLPVTFYKSDKDLPEFTNYTMDNRTYRYFTGQPQYGFGYGLSYTTFRYDKLILPATIAKGNTVTVSARVTNTGKMNGEEVVQLYVSRPVSNVKMPLKALKGFNRITLKAGESKLVTFKLTKADLSIVTETGKMVEPGGDVNISIGGAQPDETAPLNGNIVSRPKIS
jgi:beta-glucosidase